MWNPDDWESEHNRPPRGKQVYVLELEGGCYYIGRTGNLRRRVHQHFIGTGAKFTRKHEPLKLIAHYPGASREERKLTLEYAAKYGWDKVRGAGWCACNPSKLKLSWWDYAKKPIG